MKSSQLTRKELLVHDRVNDLMEQRSMGLYEQLSAEELQRNRAALEIEIEKLEKEKIIEDLSAAKQVSDRLNMEREERIENLEKERALQDAAISRRELLISRQQTVRNTLIIIVLFSIVISLALPATWSFVTM